MGQVGKKRGRPRKPEGPISGAARNAAYRENTKLRILSAFENVAWILGKQLEASPEAGEVMLEYMNEDLCHETLKALTGQKIPAAEEQERIYNLAIAALRHRLKNVLFSSYI